MLAALRERTSLERAGSFLALLILIIGYICWRSQWAALPFYWDEAWVYAPAVRAMSAAGPSMFPDAIDPSLSRGHPLLFHFIAAVWARIFGNDAMSLHAFALVISVALLFAVYFIGRSLCNGPTGLVMAATLLAHEGFLAQGGLLLPELMLALWVVLAWFFFLRKQWPGYILFGSLALLTKEAGLVLVLALTTWRTWTLITTKETDRRAQLRELGLTLLPLIPFAGHFAIQYMTFGWVLFPQHIALITPGLKDVAYKSRLIFTAVFEEQGRFFLTLAYCLLPLIYWKRGNPVLRMITAVLYVASIKALWGRWPLPFIPEPLSTLFLLAAIFLLFHSPYDRSLPDKTPGPGSAFVFVVAFWAFCAMNFYTDRYLLMLHPILIIGGGLLLWQMLSAVPRWVFHLVMWAGVLAQAFLIGADDKVGDTRMSHIDAIIVEQNMVGHLERMGLYRSSILTDFMNKAYLTDPRAGYLRSEKIFTLVTTETEQGTDLVIVSNSSSDDISSHGGRVLHREEKGHAWIELRAGSTYPRIDQ